MLGECKLFINDKNGISTGKIILGGGNSGFIITIINERGLVSGEYDFILLKRKTSKPKKHN